MTAMSFLADRAVNVNVKRCILQMNRVTQELLKMYMNNVIASLLSQNWSKTFIRTALTKLTFKAPLVICSRRRLQILPLFQK